jgi:hypothetical protein
MAGTMSYANDVTAVAIELEYTHTVATFCINGDSTVKAQ